MVGIQCCRGKMLARATIHCGLVSLGALIGPALSEVARRVLLGGSEALSDELLPSIWLRFFFRRYGPSCISRLEPSQTVNSETVVW